MNLEFIPSEASIPTVGAATGPESRELQIPPQILHLRHDSNDGGTQN